MKKYKKSIGIFLFLIIVTLPFFVFAIEIPNPIEYDDLADLVHAIVSFIRRVAIYLAPIIFIVAALMYYLSAGNPEKAQQATNLIKWSLIGLVIILIANGITAVIKDIIGAND